jgi:hypothetical protein
MLLSIYRCYYFCRYGQGVFTKSIQMANTEHLTHNGPVIRVSSLLIKEDVKVIWQYEIRDRRF